MVKRDPVQSLTQEFISGDVSRREFMKRVAALGLATAGVGAGLGSPGRHPRGRRRLPTPLS